MFGAILQFLLFIYNVVMGPRGKHRQQPPLHRSFAEQLAGEIVDGKKEENEIRCDISDPRIHDLITVHGVFVSSFT